VLSPNTSTGEYELVEGTAREVPGGAAPGAFNVEQADGEIAKVYFNLTRGAIALLQ